MGYRYPALVRIALDLALVSVAIVFLVVSGELKLLEAVLFLITIIALLLLVEGKRYSIAWRYFAGFGLAAIHCVLILWVFLVVLIGSGAGNSRDAVESKSRSKQFGALHSLVLREDFSNVAVLPEEGFIVVDKIVINVKNHTFGDEPDLGFYEEYYRNGSKSHFDVLEQLLKKKNIRLSEQGLNKIVSNMEDLGIQDVTKDAESNLVVYAWNCSAMHGANGVVYTSTGAIPPARKRDFSELQQIEKRFYYWEQH